MSETSKLVNENQTAMGVLKLKESELLNHKAEVKKVARIKEVLIKKNRILEDQKFQADFVRKGIRADNDSRMLEIDRRKREIESTRKNLDDLTRERDILKGNLGKTQIESTKLASLLLLQKQQKANIELEMVRIKQEMAQHNKEYRIYQKELKEGMTEINKTQSQCSSILAELKDKEVSIFDFKRQMLQAENKLKHQQNLYEGIQSDRNLHAKKLIESQAEIAEMKRKLRIMNFQINGYKDDINCKEASVACETAENMKLVKDTALIDDEIKTLKNQNMLAQAYIRSQMAEEVKLDQFAKEAEIERSRQENALSVLVNERDNLSTQLIHRNEELTTVYDKIKTQQSSLIRGEAYYREKLKNIRILCEQLHDKKLQRMALVEETSGISGMRKTITYLQNQVIQEQMRIKALEEELYNPINVHRWRKLEGSNPEAFDMLQMLHTLQKKLIAKTKEEKEKQKAIEIKEKVYLHLKAMLAKQVGPEASEQSSEFVKVLKEKKLQLRHMDTELNMYQAQVREYKYSIKQLDGGLADIKKKFLGMYMKRAEQTTGPTGPMVMGEHKLEPIEELPPLPNDAQSPDPESFNSSQVSESGHAIDESEFDEAVEV
jgi:chromosome segregation ATPase